MKLQHYKSILYLLLCVATTSFAQSNSLYQKTYTKQDGIELDKINALCFDNDGFLWIGGSNLDNRTIVLSDKKLTLQRFNGYSFHNIPLPDLGSKILEVVSITKRKDGKFYITITTQDGMALLLLDPVTSIFKNVTFYNTLKIRGLSNVYHYNNTDYILSQKGREITLNMISENLEVEQLFSFTSNENKYLIEKSSVFIPFKDFCIVSDDNLSVTYLDWNGKKSRTFFTK